MRDSKRKKAISVALGIMMLAAAFVMTGCALSDGSTARQLTDLGSASVSSAPTVSSNGDLDITDIPEYDGQPAIDINDGEPSFTDRELTEVTFEKFSRLDDLGRCGAAVVCIDEKMMPEGERDSIGMIKPSGWQIEKYDFIDNGGYLYNRCHLVGWQLTGENAEERNLITGTRYMNTEGMLPYENEAAEYLRSSGNHIMYRVTPIFDGDELVARGVHMEAMSVEDDGEGLAFNVFCYNVQPGVEIDYQTGESAAGDAVAPAERSVNSEEPSGKLTYVLNKNTMRFHYLGCSGAANIKAKNRGEFTGERQELIDRGYRPCGICNP